MMQQQRWLIQFSLFKSRKATLHVGVSILKWARYTSRKLTNLDNFKTFEVNNNSWVGSYLQGRYLDVDRTSSGHLNNSSNDGIDSRGHHQWSPS